MIQELAKPPGSVDEALAGVEFVAATLLVEMEGKGWVK
jgi:hypothetical protein